jgi:glycosyltransferase involved in cell wall biosynthesis
VHGRFTAAECAWLTRYPGASVSDGQQLQRILFLNQGLASPVGVMGHPRAHDALRSVPDSVYAGLGVEPTLQELRPFSRFERVLKKRLPGAGPHDLGPFRWQLARGQAAREVVTGVVQSQSHDAVHLTTHVAGLTLGRLYRQVPVALSVDVPMWQWQQILRRLPPRATPTWDMRAALQLEKRALEAAAVVVAWTDTVAAQLRIAAPAAKIMTIHPGLDIQSFTPGGKSRRADPVRVLFVGGRFRDKGGNDLLDALAPELGTRVELDVVTTSPEVPALPGLRVHRLRPNDPRLLALFREADIFCLPSHSDAVPWVVLEAMSSGCAVVASKVGSIDEMLGHGTAGATVDAGNVQELRSLLRMLIENPERRATMGRAARARAGERYDAQRQTARLASAMRDLAVMWHGSAKDQSTGGPPDSILPGA